MRWWQKLGDDDDPMQIGTSNDYAKLENWTDRDSAFLFD